MKNNYFGFERFLDLLPLDFTFFGFTSKSSSRLSYFVPDSSFSNIVFRGGSIIVEVRSSGFHGFHKSKSEINDKTDSQSDLPFKFEKREFQNYSN